MLAVGQCASGRVVYKQLGNCRSRKKGVCVSERPMYSCVVVVQEGVNLQ